MNFQNVSFECLDSIRMFWSKKQENKFFSHCNIHFNARTKTDKTSLKKKEHQNKIKATFKEKLNSNSWNVFQIWFVFFIHSLEKDFIEKTSCGLLTSFGSFFRFLCLGFLCRWSFPFWLEPFHLGTQRFFGSVLICFTVFVFRFFFRIQRRTTRCTFMESNTRNVYLLVDCLIR